MTRNRAIVGALAVLAIVALLAVLASEQSEAIGFAGAALLGIVEGFTEYLPVSSTGHLVLVTRALWPDFDSAALDSYLIVIQAGAIVAVFGLYWRRVVGMMMSGHRGTEERRLGIRVLVAFLPAAAVGLLVGDVLKGRLFGVAPIAWAWIVGGLVILWAERRQDQVIGDSLGSLRIRQAALIGLSQVLALWPGVSRSLVTILGGRVVGLSTAASVEFSFLLGAVTLLAASFYEAAGSLDAILSEIGPGPAIVGFAAATASAFAAARWLVGYVTRHSLAIFGWYRIGIGVAVLVLLA